MFDFVLRRELLPRRRFGPALGIAGVFYAGAVAFAVWAEGQVRVVDRQDVLIKFVARAGAGRCGPGGRGRRGGRGRVRGSGGARRQKAIEREVEGVMEVRCVVGTDGLVRECQVLKSLPFMDRAVIEALERRRYVPATLGGEAVDVYYRFRLPFRLADAARES